VKLCDKILLKNPGSAEFFIPVYNKPEKVAENKYKLADGAYITFEGDFETKIETIKFDVESFVKDWGKEEIYKFRLATKEDLAEIKLCAKITHN
jgi:hypothetical protein